MRDLKLIFNLFLTGANILKICHFKSYFFRHLANFSTRTPILYKTLLFYVQLVDIYGVNYNRAHFLIKHSQRIGHLINCCYLNRTITYHMYILSIIHTTVFYY